MDYCHNIAYLNRIIGIMVLADHLLEVAMFKGGQIRLRTALLIPYMVFIGVLVSLLIFVWQRDYEWIANEQGSKMATAVNENTIHRIDEFMMDPERVNALFASELKFLLSNDTKDLSVIQKHALNFLKTALGDTGNISVVSYGDEMGRFVGFRLNDDGSISLMLKDERTNGLLNIYALESMNSEVMGSYEGYDPRTRPWYAPVKENPNRQWSNIYINADEKMQATISNLIPVYNEKQEFSGVADIDIKLDGINAFLKDGVNKGTGVIYIIDKDWNVIAHSGDEASTKLTKDQAGNPVAEMSKAYQSDNTLIRETAEYIESNQISANTVSAIQLSSGRVYTQMKRIEASNNLNWQVIAVIPEVDLLGAVREHQRISMWIIIIMAIGVALIGFVVISRIIRPIKDTAKAAMSLSAGNFNAQMPSSKDPISEISELATAFNGMAENLKHSFELIQNREEIYRTLVENVDDMIYSLTPTGVFLSINNRFEEEVGISRDELLGLGVDAIFPEPKDRLFWQEQLFKVATQQQKLQFTYEYTKRDGVRKIYNVSLMPQKDNMGRIASVLGTNTDVTRLIEAHEEISVLHNKEKETLEKMVDERTNELKTAMNELIEKEKLASLGGLVSGIAHEINTPLGVSVSAASYLKEVNDKMVNSAVGGQMTKSELLEYFHTLDETSKILNSNLYRASELVKSFKEISIGQVTEDRSQFNVKEYLEMILLSLKHEYKRTGHQILIECSDMLLLDSYPGVFAQIFTNLIMNALIHGLSARESGTIRIQVTTEKGTMLTSSGVISEQVKIVFSDNGAGIAKENISKIFEPFYTTNRTQGGSGLGLSVVYNLITGKLGGKISCSSVLGEGTTFTIIIPKQV